MRLDRTRRHHSFKYLTCAPNSRQRSSRSKQPMRHLKRSPNVVKRRSACNGHECRILDYPECGACKMHIDFNPLPKIELHCHLDASLRVSTVAELGRKIGLDLPNPLKPALIAPECCIDLADYLVRIDLALEVMQQRDHLVRVAREVVEDLAADGVIYGEIRFAPQLHLRNGLNMQEVLSAVHEGLKQGEQQTGMKTGLIVCCLRHESGECSLEMAKLAVNNRDKVCALDLAGDEARYIGAPHVEAFALAKREGLRRTVHAGEAAGAESIREALDLLGAERIGHGVRIIESTDLEERAKTTRLPLEMCP